MAVPPKKTSQYRASIVIPTYNRPQLAQNVARSIKALYKSNLEVVIVDQTGEEHPNVTIARNKGVEQCHAEIVIFFDDDIEITKNTIEAHLKEYANPQTVGVAGRVINDGEVVPTDTVVETGKTNFLKTAFSMNFWSTKYQNVDFVYGCNMSFKKSAMTKVGGFDTVFPAPLSAFEEIDFSLRIKNYGDIKFAPDALVYHHRASTGGTRVEEQKRNLMYYYSLGRLIKKHVPAPFSLISILIRMRTAHHEAAYAVKSLIEGYLGKKYED